MIDRKKLRDQIRKLRRELPAPYRKQCSFKFSERFAELESYQSSERVAGFLPFDGEADPTPLMDRAIQQGKSVYVPIIVAKAQPLLFAPWTRTTKLKENRFGIKEPDVPCEEMVEASALDFVITPLVAFDDKCNRMGVGGGFYDRTFAFLNDQADAGSGKRPEQVGIAFEIQRVKKIPTEEWDVRLSAIITEFQIYSG